MDVLISIITMIQKLVEHLTERKVDMLEIHLIMLLLHHLVLVEEVTEVDQTLME